ncbi:MAG: nucleotidyl transferase AbiEii/AbiGii toxin family protein [Propionibacteriaceae bacterium]|nr:nucleotidyl transferase AbiEii/AbiGii toxin family protein [Propionibacteriaceae bacterium]
MKEIHRRLAGLALSALEPYGFVLAGGYAISAHGIGDRPSQDVDLFTNSDSEERFAEAVARLHEALTDAGWTIEAIRERPLFVDWVVTDSSSQESSSLQLGRNYREFPPSRIEIGPVLDIRDAVASKMSALWSRGEARDYIDVDAVLQSHLMTRPELLALADEQEAQPFDRRVLAGQFRAAARHGVSVYEFYGVNADRRADIVARFRGWADEIEDQGQRT